MREKKLYTCEICNTDYAEKESAAKCEKNHELLGKATIVGKYKAMGIHPSGKPYRIMVKFPGSNDWTDYKLL